MDKKFIPRFPELAEQIFQQLSNEDMVKSKEVDKAWCDLIDQRLVWKRMIQSSTKDVEDYKFEFNLVLKKMPSDILKKFALACLETKILNEHLSPLHIAADCGDLLLYKYILEKSSDKNPKHLYDNTPLHYAAWKGNFEICKLIVLEVDNKNPRNRFGRTPLHYAAKKGHSEIYKFIAERVEEKNPLDDSGRTPLHQAAMKGHSELYKFIAERVEEKNPLDNEEKTPFHLAFDNGHLQICRIYLDILGIENPTLTEPEANRLRKE